jgi:hypothetical protein
VNGQTETESVAHAPDLKGTDPHHSDLIRLAKRHPATIALIQEITAEVSAATDRRFELAKAELRAGLVFRHGLFRNIDLVTVGVFTTLNLLLVTAALALTQLMAPWLAGLLVSGVSLTATTAVIVRSSGESRVWVPSLRKLAVRRFARRLFANV